MCEYIFTRYIRISCIRGPSINMYPFATGIHPSIPPERLQSQTNKNSNLRSVQYRPHKPSRPLVRLPDSTVLGMPNRKNTPCNSVLVYAITLVQRCAVASKIRDAVASWVSHNVAPCSSRLLFSLFFLLFLVATTHFSAPHKKRFPLEAQALSDRRRLFWKITITERSSHSA